MEETNEAEPAVLFAENLVYSYDVNREGENQITSTQQNSSATTDIPAAEDVKTLKGCYSCHVCQMILQNSDSLAHTNGRRHLKMLKQQKGVSGVSSTAATTEELLAAFQPRREQAKNTTIHGCNVCNVYNMTPIVWASHLNGKRHKISMKNAEDSSNNGIYIIGLTEDTTQSALLEAFSRFGSISSVVKPHRKAFGFVHFNQKESVVKALSNRVYVAGRPVIVKRKRQTKPLQVEATTVDNVNAKVRPRAKRNKKWNKEEDEMPAVNFVGDNLEEQLICVLDQIAASREEMNKHADIFRDLECFFDKYLPGVRACPFGSTFSGLALKNSDVDVFMESELLLQNPSINFVSGREVKAIYSSTLFSAVHLIRGARIPIIKCTHNPSMVQCDINFKNKWGCWNTELITFLLSVDDRIRPIMLFLKYWAKKHGVIQVNRMTSYSFVLLVIFYLQTIEQPLLPPVTLLKQNSPVMCLCGPWQSSFSNDASMLTPTENKNSIRELLTGFFEFCSTFHFSENVLCLELGQALPCSTFDDIEQLPAGLNRYIQAVKEDSRNELVRNNQMDIQDPLELNINTNKLFSSKAMQQFVSCCTKAACMFKNLNESVILCTVLGPEGAPDKSPANLEFRIPYACVHEWQLGNIIENKKPLPEAHKLWLETVIKALVLVFEKILGMTVTIKNTKGGFEAKRAKLKNGMIAQDDDPWEPKTYLCQAVVNIWAYRKRASRRFKKHQIDAGIQICSSEHERHVALSMWMLKGMQKTCKKNFFVKVLVTVTPKTEADVVSVNVSIANLIFKENDFHFDTLRDWCLLNLKVSIQQAARYLLTTTPYPSSCDSSQAANKLIGALSTHANETESISGSDRLLSALTTGDMS